MQQYRLQQKDIDLDSLLHTWYLR